MSTPTPTATSATSTARDASVTRFVSSWKPHYVNPPPLYLNCAICHSTVQEPVICAAAAHTFCKLCLTKWIHTSTSRHPEQAPSCPIDRVPLPDEIQSAPLMLYDILDDLEVFCSLGCGWQGKQRERALHLKDGCPEAQLARQRYAGAVSGPDTFMKARCDECESSIYGSNYKCVSGCKNHDLCSGCWDSESVAIKSHRARHSFALVKDPQDFFPSADYFDTEMPRHEYYCDACGAEPIRGVRFRCRDCECDFCEICMTAHKDELIFQSTGQPHDRAHRYYQRFVSSETDEEYAQVLEAFGIPVALNQ